MGKARVRRNKKDKKIIQGRMAEDYNNDRRNLEKCRDHERENENSDW